ncbi:MAG TPA: hypothetical protein VHV74_15105 [Pseudonocardiaceae bacterium]|nr:hypothetical protein [Pseudonocardiaceae bacterium]
MRYGLPGLAGLAVVGVLAAACGTGNAATDNMASVNNDAVGTSMVSGLGTVLVDSAGKALYFNDQDHGPTVACTAGCTAVWVPAVVPGTTAPNGSVTGVTVVKRSDDGKEQLAYQGKPLYEFKADSMAGQVTGNGAQDSFGGTAFTWHAAGVAGNAVPTPPSPPGGGGAGSIPGY